MRIKSDSRICKTFMRSMTACRLTLVLMMWACLPHLSLAGLRPIFHLQNACWFASDVVVADEGDRMDGHLTVLEVWRGPMEPGELIHVPELAEFADPSAGRIDPVDVAEALRPKSNRVTGRRMILFLRPNLRSEPPWNDWSLETWSATRPGKRSGPDQPRRWGPAHPWHHGIHTSTIWMESGRPFVRTQVKNPGPLKFTLPRESVRDEAEIKQAVDRVSQIIEMLEHAALETSPTRKIRWLDQLLRSPHLPHQAWEEVMGQLVDCGREALPLLKAMYPSTPAGQQTDLLLETYQGAIIRFYGTSNGLDAQRILRDHLIRALDFWIEADPTLPVGWWQEQGMEPKQARAFKWRWSQVHALLQSWQELNGRPGMLKQPNFSNVRSFWLRLRTSEQREILGGVREVCKRLRSQLSNRD